MTNYANQIQRIKDKLIEAKKVDENLEVFGAKKHKYHLNEPTTIEVVTAFEKKYSIELPNCYKAFVLEIGNGGNSWGNAAAGPFYGIFPFGENIDELLDENVEVYLKNKCVIFPKMSDAFWKNLTKNIDENEEMPDEEFEKELCKLWAGILPIGSQGCNYLHGIVLNGPYKGKVVNIDKDRQKPTFTFETNFLDWYERWLDEIISGDLIKNRLGWFGYNKGGTAEQLLTSLVNSTNLEEKHDNLYGLLNKQMLSAQTIDQVEQLINTNFEPKTTLIKLLCKSNYEKAKPYLIELAKTDLCSLYQFIYWFAKDKCNEWIAIIEENISKIKDQETFRYCCYILTETNTNFGKLIVPFTKNSNEKIRVQAIYTLGELKNKEDYIECFIEGLQDKSNQVIRTTLQALENLKDNRLLKYYKQISEKFPTEQDYILVNLDYRLAEYNLTHKTILNLDTN